MIKIKNTDILGKIFLSRYHPLLIIIILEVEKKFDKVTITSPYRHGDKGVHGTDPCRGIDIKSWDFKKPEEVVDFVNGKFTYDPERVNKKCAILHDTSSGIHIHLQSHDNTVYNKG